MSKYLDKPARSKEEAAADIRNGLIKQMRAMIDRASKLIAEMEKINEV